MEETEKENRLHRIREWAIGEAARHTNDIEMIVPMAIIYEDYVLHGGKAVSIKAILKQGEAEA